MFLRLLLSIVSFNRVFFAYMWRGSPRFDIEEMSSYWYVFCFGRSTRWGPERPSCSLDVLGFVVEVRLGRATRCWCGLRPPSGVLPLCLISLDSEARCVRQFREWSACVECR